MKFLSFLLLWLAGGAIAASSQSEYQKAQDLVDGRALRSLSRVELARVEKMQEQTVAGDPQLHEAAFALAEVYIARGAYEQATERYRALVEARPDDGHAYAGLGFSLAAQGRYSGAMRAYQDALRRGEKSALVYARLGHVYQALGHLPENLNSAGAAYRASLQIDREQPEILYQLGRVEARGGRIEAAGKLMEQALQAAPDDSGIRVELAAMYRAEGQLQLARGVIAQGLELNGDEPVLLQELGRFLWEDGDGVRALAQFERALAIDPELPLAYRYMGLIHSAAGRLQEALAAFAELATRQPADAATRVNIGIVHSRMGDLAAAERAFKTAVELGGAGGDAALKLGGLYVHQRRLLPAVKLMREATLRHPQNAELFASLGDIYRQLGLLSAAQETGTVAVRLDPGRALWRFHLASTYERLDLDRARTEWQQYLELALDDEQEASRLDYARERLRQLKEKVQ